jgi:predicted GIY-YIG superfamily endonuclease
MATISEKYIGNHEVHTSPRGAKYIITDDGRKLYISSTNKTYRRSFKPRPGAYARFLNAQNSV